MSRLSIFAAVAALGLAGAAHAQSVTAGSILNIAADPQDFVVELERAGPCGSRYFHVQRSNVNFREMAALSLTAFAASRPMTMFVVSCAGDRNIISHGYASR